MTVSSLAQYSFAFNDFIFGNGTPYSIQNIDGLTALPVITNQDDDSGYSDGMFTGTDFIRSRTVNIHILTTSGNGHSAAYNFNLLRKALLPQRAGVTPLQFQLGAENVLQRVNGRVRGMATPLDPDYTYGQILSMWTFFCPDPIIYDDMLKTSTILVSAVSGRTYNRIYPLVYGGGSASFYTPVVNDGDWETLPVITINGPIINPTVGNFTTGKSIVINGTYIAGDVIIIDLNSKLITLNGVSARNLITGASKWFTAPAGTTQFYLTGSGTLVGTTSATVAYHSAYI